MFHKSFVTLVALGALALVSGSAAAQDRAGADPGTADQAPPAAGYDPAGQQQGTPQTGEQGMPQTGGTQVLRTPTDQANPQIGTQRQGTMGSQQGQQDSPAANIDKMDANFLTRKAETSLYEQKLGQLAQQKAMSDDVKKLGQRLIDDHDKSSGQLTTLIQQRGLSMPSDVNAADQARLDQLSKLSGAQFDKSFVTQVIVENQRDANAIQVRAKLTKDADVKGFAAGLGPQQEQHAQMARDVHAKIMNEKSPTPSPAPTP